MKSYNKAIKNRIGDQKSNKKSDKKLTKSPKVHKNIPQKSDEKGNKNLSKRREKNVINKT